MGGIRDGDKNYIVNSGTEDNHKKIGDVWAQDIYEAGRKAAVKYIGQGPYFIDQKCRGTESERAVIRNRRRAEKAKKNGQVYVGAYVNKEDAPVVRQYLKNVRIATGLKDA